MFCVCTVTSQWYQSRSRPTENLISISGHCWGGRDLGSPVVHIEKVCVHSDGGVAPSQLSSVQIKIEPICLMVELCTMVKILLHKGKSKLSNWRFLGKRSESYCWIFNKRHHCMNYLFKYSSQCNICWTWCLLLQTCPLCEVLPRVGANCGLLANIWFIIFLKQFLRCAKSNLRWCIIWSPVLF